jgi:hypothetical protein
LLLLHHRRWWRGHRFQFGYTLLDERGVVVRWQMLEERVA